MIDQNLLGPVEFLMIKCPNYVDPHYVLWILGILYTFQCKSISNLYYIPSFIVFCLWK